MVSVEIAQAAQPANRSIINEQPTSPRISFSADFLDESNFISITPQSQQHSHQGQKDQEKARLQEKGGRNIAADPFEFLSNTSDVSSHNMLSADELFFEGKLLPFWQMQHSLEKLNKISLKTKDCEKEEDEEEAIHINNDNHNQNKEAAATEARVSWFVDDDPSPRPPKCTVLWKELLRLKKQRASSLSPSSSSSSTSSSSSSLADIVTKEDGKEGPGNRDNKHVKRIKKGLERTRSASIRIRPMVNVPICTAVKSSAMPPLFPLKKGRLEI
ncbi:hypothetical protein KPL70_001770 [Citrus sinensis]|uniref:uncharacterized protein LOC102610523 n=1 Tax=Citrus sinensis TaxID=2711 RepID=UPI00218F48F0|nr:uncharacterized protein LOC102610523 [Citrus sinensis]KAH9765135.1 hypothetical protein KPL70_001770 [Citrus sinensis]